MPSNAKWAVITGASSGIGRALAFEFASGGFHLFLTGRDAAALDEVARECADRHGSETCVVAADLSDSNGVDTVIAALESEPRTYSVLVNNAGFGIHGAFASHALDDNLRLLDLQVKTALRLTRTLLPGMLERRDGRILNVASVYSFSPVPFQSVYAASKSFLFSFSQSLRSELGSTGVTVTVLCPGITRTAFRSRAGISEKRPDSGMRAAVVAHIAYQGAMRGQPVVVPGFMNRMFVIATRLLPIRMLPALMRFINRRRGQFHS